MNNFHQVHVSIPLLGRDPLWFDSCKQPLSLCILGGRLQKVRLYEAKLQFFINLPRGRECKPKKPSVGVVWILFGGDNTSITSLVIHCISFLFQRKNVFHSSTRIDDD